MQPYLAVFFSLVAQWPGVSGGSVQPLHHDSKLFGGAAFERCLEEFHMAVAHTRFPTSAYVCPHLWDPLLEGLWGVELGHCSARALKVI